MWSNPQLPADLFTFTDKVLNGKLHFLYSALLSQISKSIQFYNCTYWILTTTWPQIGSIQKSRKTKLLSINVLESTERHTYVCVSGVYSMLMLRSFALRNFWMSLYTLKKKQENFKTYINITYLAFCTLQ